MGVKAPSQPVMRRGSLPQEGSDKSMPNSLKRFGKHPQEKKRMSFGQKIGSRSANTANATLLEGPGGSANNAMDGGADAGGNTDQMEVMGGPDNTTQMENSGGPNNWRRVARRMNGSGNLRQMSR